MSEECFLEIKIKGKFYVQGNKFQIIFNYNIIIYLNEIKLAYGRVICNSMFAAA